MYKCKIISDVEIEHEIRVWSNNREIPNDDITAFELGFRAGIAFACRSQNNIPCFCGNHISDVQ